MRVVFIGTGEIGVPVLRALLAANEIELAGVVTQPDKPAGRAQQLQPPPIKTALADAPVVLLQPERIRREEAVAQIRALTPDVIVVMAYGQILPRTVLEIPPVACLNLHASLLPRHRGAAPIQAAIVAGDRESGITVMHMDEGLDTGDILLERRLPIRRRETGRSLHDRLAEIAPGALFDALGQLRDGTSSRTPQEPAAATYAPKLTREMGRIDWTESCELIERKIRAYDPWPSAFMLLPESAPTGRKLKIFRAIAMRKTSGAPGTILRADSCGLLVGADRGALLLREVQLEGKRRMAAAEFIRGHELRVAAARA